MATEIISRRRAKRRDVHVKMYFEFLKDLYQRMKKTRTMPAAIAK